MAAYGQFCPVAKAMELLDERWTMGPGAKAGTLEIRGPSHVARKLPRWFRTASITVTTPPPGSSLVR
jgi:hypothetical protein